jgi:alpha-ribazole phosphatase
MVRLILVRHGVTEWNEARKYIGSTDLPLTEKGREQARAAASSLREELITAVYSSAAKRAQQSAEIIGAQHDIELEAIPELNEMDFGAWEGMTFEQISEKWPNFIHRWLYTDEELPPEGEALPRFKERVRSAVARIVDSNPDGNVLVVAHAGPIKLIVCDSLGLEFSEIWRIRKDSCGISRIHIADDGSRTLLTFNDTCHLTSL